MTFDLLDILLLLVGAGIFWWLIGGWSSLRTPRVFAPLVVAALCVAIGAWASAGIDAIRAGAARPFSAEAFGRLTVAAMVVATIAFGWALVAGYRLRVARKAPPAIPG